jgi:hypothetical protein
MHKPGDKSRGKRKSLSELIKEVASSLAPEQQLLALKADRLDASPFAEDATKNHPAEQTNDDSKDIPKTTEKTKTKTKDNYRQRKKQIETNGRQLETVTVDNVRQFFPILETNSREMETDTVDNQRLDKQQLETKSQISDFYDEKQANFSSNSFSFDRQQNINDNLSSETPAPSAQSKNLSTVDNDLSTVLSPIKSDFSPKKKPLSSVVSSSVEERQHFQLETESDDNCRQKRLLPSSRQQLLILQFLAESQVQIGLDHSARYKTSELSEKLGIPWKGLRKQIARLVDSGFLLKVDSREGRGDSGTVYRVPLPVLSVLKNMIGRRPQLETTGDRNWRQQLETNFLVSSSSNKTTTNSEDKDKEFGDRLQSVLQRLDLEQKGIGANDVLDIWRRGVFKELSDLEASLEHLAFYLESPNAQGINHPKAWLLGQLRKGYYPAPAGFKSLEERQEEAKLEDARKKLERLRELRRQRFEAEFEIWLSELTEEKKKKLAGVLDINSRAALSLYKEAFKAERGMEFQEV